MVLSLCNDVMALSLLSLLSLWNNVMVLLLLSLLWLWNDVMVLSLWNDVMVLSLSLWNDVMVLSLLWLWNDVMVLSLWNDVMVLSLSLWNDVMVLSLLWLWNDVMVLSLLSLWNDVMVLSLFTSPPPPPPISPSPRVIFIRLEETRTQHSAGVFSFFVCFVMGYLLQSNETARKRIHFVFCRSCLSRGFDNEFQRTTGNREQKTREVTNGYSTCTKTGTVLTKSIMCMLQVFFFLSLCTHCRQTWPKRGATPAMHVCHRYGWQLLFRCAPFILGIPNTLLSDFVF